MTRERAKELLPVFEAFVNGRQIECRESNPGGNWVTISVPVWKDSCDYRIKPEPKLRPWRPEEVPMPCVLRWRGDVKVARWMVLSVSEYGIATCNCCVPGQTLIESFASVCDEREHSVDGGKTWLPCGVAEVSQ